MLTFLQRQLSSSNGVVRKCAIAALQVPKHWHSLHARPDDYRAAPPVLANSFPKSGTHLLFQIVDGLPGCTNFGSFLASMTSSFQFRERSAASVSRFIRGFVPGEIVRGHLFYDPRYAADLLDKNVVHLFIYRDPRDVVVSEAHYLREMNRWHRLGPYFRRVPSIDDAIMLSITGFDPPITGLEYPSIATRFARYAGWLTCDDCLAIRFEELASAEHQATVIRQVAEYFARRSSTKVDIDSCVAAMTSRIAPERSHTYRQGKKAGWQREFTADHRHRFDEVAGELLIRLGYESSHDWAHEQGAGSREQGVPT